MGITLRYWSLGWRRLRAVLVGVALLGMGLGVFLGGVGSAGAKAPRARRVVDRPASLPFSGRGGVASGASALRGSSLKVPGARRFAPVVRVGAQVASLRRADSDTFLAGDGRLLTKIYPFAVNYRTGSGVMAPIDSRLLAAGGGFAQAANDLGLRFPGAASGAVRASGRTGGVSVALLGGSGRGSVSGSVERFGSASSGVALSYSSLAWGAGWRASLSGVAAGRGLRWLVRGSRGMSVRLYRGGVEFLDRAGRRSWIFTAPTAQTAGSLASLRTRLSLRRTGQGEIVTETVPAARSVAAATPAGSVRADAVPGKPDSVVLSGLLVPGAYAALSGSEVTGDCYVDGQTSQNKTTSFCSGSVNYVGESDHTLLNFDVADNVPGHVQVLQSYVSMALASESTTTAEGIGVWQAAKPWTNQATWNDYDGTNPWAKAGGDTTGAMEDVETIGASSDVGASFYWDVDPSMQGWVDGNPPQNEGLLFEGTNPGSATNRLGFLTQTSSSDGPYLGVYYETRGGDYPGSHYDTQQLTDHSTAGVNVANGDLEVSNQDLHLTGINGLDVNIGRYYNSLSNDQDSLGLGWTMGTGADTYLVMPSDENDVIDYFDGTGSAQLFYKNPSGQWVTPPGVDATVSVNSDDTYDSTVFTLFFRHSGITETFTSATGLPKYARLSSVSNRDGRTITYSYNGSGQLASLVDSYGATTTFTYSSAGYVSKITDPTGRTYQYGQDSSGHLTTYTDPAGNITHYSYDSYGNLTKIVTGAGNVTTIAYDAGNTNRVTSITRLVHPTDMTGPTTGYQYAPAGATCTTAGPGWMQTTATNPRGYVTTFCTDDLSRLEQTIDANGNTRGTSYSTDGYVSQLMSGLNTPTAFTYSTDGDDNVTQIADGTGASPITTKLSYPPSGSGQGPNQYLPTGSTDPQTNQQTYGYDANGNVQTSTDQLPSQNTAKIAYDETPGETAGEYDGEVSSSTDADQHTTTYGYTNGNLTSITAPASSGLNLTTLSYDSANRVVTLSTVANGTGHEIDYTYDKFDRITQEIYKNASGATTETLTYTYDADGNLKTSTDSQGTTTYCYDGLNRLTGETFPNSSTDTYGYDPAGNLTTLTDAGGTVTYGYDPANQLNSITDPGATGATSLSYDADGNLTNTTYPSGASVVRGYNAEDQLMSVTDNYKTSTGAAANLAYGYTYSGDLQATSTSASSSTNTTYSYDQLNRLTEALVKPDQPRGGGGNQVEYVYTLDGAGNITALTQGQPNNPTTTSYTYNPANEIATGSGHSYTYDTDGNQTSNGNGLSAAYNPSQQTTSITSAGTATPYAYFGTGQDQIATEGSNALHDDTLGLASHQAGSSTVYFTRSISGEQIDERTSSGTYNYLYDGNGSVIGITNSQGQLVNQYSYDPYGNRTTTSATAPDYFGFQGGYLTPSGLYHFGARYYNPADERWTQEDPLRNIGSLTQSDRYAFAGDDPVSNSDPSGAFLEPILRKVAACGVLLALISCDGDENFKIGLGSDDPDVTSPITYLNDAASDAKALETDAGNLIDDGASLFGEL